MTNYEKLMSEMTLGKMAVEGVKLILVNNREPFYVTSTGQLVPYDKFEQAVQMEYQWLSAEAPEMQEYSTEESVTADEETCDCEAES